MPLLLRLYAFSVLAAGAALALSTLLLEELALDQSQILFGDAVALAVSIGCLVGLPSGVHDT